MAEVVVPDLSIGTIQALKAAALTSEIVIGLPSRASEWGFWTLLLAALAIPCRRVGTALHTITELSVPLITIRTLILLWTATITVGVVKK